MKKILLVCLAVMLVGGVSTLTQGADEQEIPSINFKGSRLAVGFFDSKSDGSYPAGSYVVPDMKLRFNIKWDKDNSAVVRMSLKNATFEKLDYFYFKSKNLLKHVMDDPPINPELHIGRFKIGAGEEWKSNNLVQSTVPSVSAANPYAYDEGIRLTQKFKKGLPVILGVAIAFLNSNTGANDNNPSKGYYVEVTAQCKEQPLHFNLSYYNSGDLDNADCEFAVAGLKKAPTNATKWERSVGSFDVRYDFKKGEKKLNPPAYNDSKAFIRASYGQFTDEITEKILGTNPKDRDGNFYFVEAKYYLIEKVYVAGRYSFIGLDESKQFEQLNSIKVNGADVTANDYKRTSVGLGYHLTDKTILKIGYTQNKEDMPIGVDEPKNNEISIMFGTYF